MSQPEPTTKPPQVGSGGEGTSPSQVTGQSGWNDLTHVLAYKVPQDLRIAHKAREGIYRLMRQAGR